MVPAWVKILLISKTVKFKSRTARKANVSGFERHRVPRLQGNDN